jgi:hypothetical protein
MKPIGSIHISPELEEIQQCPNDKKMSSLDDLQLLHQHFSSNRRPKTRKLVLKIHAEHISAILIEISEFQRRPKIISISEALKRIPNPISIIGLISNIHIQFQLCRNQNSDHSFDITHAN